MPPPGYKAPARRYGLVGEMPDLDYFSEGVGVDELRERGWTLVLIEKFLGDEDRRDAVNHWANFSGKKVYLMGRIEAAESMPEFEAEFIRSASRRKLLPDFTKAVVERCRTLRLSRQTK
jgi:hypothetical protein